MCSGSVYCNPLGPPINLWTTGTVGRQFVLSVHCVMFVSVVSPLSPSLWVEMSSSCDECAPESDCGICSVIAWSVRFLPVATLLNALWHNSAYTKPHTFCLIMIWTSVLRGLSHYIARHGTDLSVELKTGISINLHFKKSEEVILTGERTFALDPHCMKRRNVSLHSLPLRLIAYELIHHSSR
jgi:hypothetical protein